MPNVLRRFLAMTARVPIIHVADTAFTTGQGAREGQPRHDHWPPSGCLRGLDYEPSTSQLQGSGRHVDGEAASDQVRDHAARSVADDAIHFVRPPLEEICRAAGPFAQSPGVRVPDPCDVVPLVPLAAGVDRGNGG